MPKIIFEDGKRKVVSGFKGKKHSDEWKRLMSERNKGNNYGSFGKGKKLTLEHRKNLSISAKKRVTENRHNNYKGGITEADKILRNSYETKIWKESVFERDNYTCQDCGLRNIKGLGKTVVLNAHHIKQWALYPELRFDIDNGITLCISCHKKKGTHGKIKI